MKRHNAQEFLRKRSFSLTLSPLLSGLCSTLLFALCSAAQAEQSTKIPRVGFLSPGSAATFESRVDAFRQGLLELGYREGENIFIEYRYADGKQDLMSKQAIEFVRLKFDLIITSTTSGVRAAKNASRTIPIVFTNVGDPVRTGLVASLARPGGNATGLSTVLSDLSGKRLELLKESFPNVKRVVTFRNPDTGQGVAGFKPTQDAARTLGLQLLSLEVRNTNDFDHAFEAAIRGRAQALLTIPTPIVNVHQTQILRFAAKNRLPAMYALPEFTETSAGGLMSYAPSYADLYRRAATYVDKVLKGRKPADLPVEQPTKFEFVINLKTAKQIGLTIPPNVLARADRVIR
ncbi:MAG TPA: ABC transporter substrate-binding protein [Candidatus Binatia bacterium]|nr:ABC transporter substrate-binding protein [Candidatus Binatia bacterium]